MNRFKYFMYCFIFFISQIGYSAVQSETIVMKSLGFVAPVNIKAFTCKGEAKVFEGKLTREGLNLKELRVRVPVSSLTTHMSLRDEHMVERIFTTADGKTPDIEYASKSATCALSGDQQDCTIDGEMKIQGITRKVPLKVKLKLENDKIVLASFSGEIKLSTFGIERPGHLGVKVKDEIELSGEFLVQ